MRMYHPAAQSGFNPCASNGGGCQHLCFGLNRTQHVCKCSIGYYVDPQNPRHCLGEDEFLLYSVGGELKGLRQYDPTSSETGEVARVLGPLSRISLASVVDYHAHADLLFWADNERGTITSIRRDGTDRRVIVKLDTQQQRGEKATGGSSIGSPMAGIATLSGSAASTGETRASSSSSTDADALAEAVASAASASSQSETSLDGLAVDWVAGNIYWSVSRRNIIEVARLNGSHPHVVLWSNVQAPRALAVDPGAGYLFYAADGRIGRIGLDGSQPFVLANRTAPVTNLAVDIEAQVVYWCEASTALIMRVDYDGNSKAVQLNHSLEHPVAVAVQNGTLYWADNAHQHGSITTAPVANMSAQTLLVKNEGSLLRDLKVFSRQLQTGSNACADANGGCEHLCLFNGTHPICACSYAQLAPDGRTCQPYAEFLLYSNIRSIESLHLTETAGEPSQPVQSIRNETVLRNAIALGYDYARKQVFYSDIASHSINSVPFAGGAAQHRVLVGKQVAVEGLCFDPIEQSLFWTSNRNASIRAVRLADLGPDAAENAGRVRTVVRLGQLDKPRGLAVESCLGMVYWTNWNTQAASIQRAFITGYGLETIIRKDIRMPNAITLDVEQNKLYWADARLDKIERANYDGTGRVVLFHSTAKHPFAIAVYGELLFWTDWVLGAVMRANKYSGTDVAYLRRGVERGMGIVAVQNTTRECAANGCQVLNGGCEDVCTVLPSTGVVRCECTRGVLAKDGRSCRRAYDAIETEAEADSRRHGDDDDADADGGTCQRYDFRCTTGHQCVPLEQTCDHIEHCADGSDEREAYCNWRHCPDAWFMCANKRCIRMEQTCDGVQHCGDGSDEAMCNCSSTDHFRCDGGQCVLASDRCDGTPDCPDNSDEKDCPRKECASGELACASGGQCYPERTRCDGRNNCDDNSDEMGCPERGSCSEDDFR